MSHAMEILEPRVDQLPVAASPQGNPMMEMLSEAIRAGQPIEVIREIKALVKEIKDDEARVAFDAAIAAAKDEIKPVVRATNGHNGKYADLATIADAIDPILSRHGLTYRHRTAQTTAGLTVTCILSHKLGHREETPLTAPADTSGNKNNIQALGSTQQYLMRYTLVASIGLATSKDDDGQAAGAGEALSEKQALDLNDLIDTVVEEVAGNRPAFVKSFLKFMKAERIEAIAAKDYQKAVNAINASRVAR